jgi:hypothetical protein
MGVMGARRRLGLGVLACMCALGCVLAGAGSAWAGGGSFLFGAPGAEAGHIDVSYGLAVDRQSGDIYASDPQNNRVNKFDGSGRFLLAWGWGVINGAEELQVCTSATGCQVGLNGTGAGEFGAENAYGVAVDNEPSSASRGDVYVVQGDEVEAFDSQGMFLRVFGGHVNKNGTDVCTAAEASQCQGGTPGAGNGELNLTSQRQLIAVGPGGDVYVGDKARVQVFEPSGAWKANISLSALSSEGRVTALAVNAAGDVFVKDEGVPGVREFEAPLFLESPTKFDEGSETVESIALDGSGDLFVSEREGSYPSCSRCGFVEYGPSGQQLESFGAHTLVYMTSAMAFDEALGGLLVYGSDTEEHSAEVEYGHNGVWAFTVPPPGPLVEPGSEQATPELRGAAALEGLVSPEGSETTVHFEYVDEADFKASGYASAVSTGPVVLKEAGFGEEHVEARLPQKALIPGVTYHWRIVAHNANGTNPGADQSFQETPAAQIDGPWVTGVTSSSVTLQAQIDPLGASTSYRLEYGTSTAYGHVFSGNAGEGMGFVPVAYHVQELQPATAYHYRVVTESEVGIVEGADHAFTTQLTGGALVLPDGRGWELVSPPVKSGALIEDVQRSQAASDGSGIVYAASEPIGEGIAGHVGNAANPIADATLLSRRGANGWRTHDISSKQTLPSAGSSTINLSSGEEEFAGFTPDLSLGILNPQAINTPLSAEATEPTAYLRNNTNETYMPLVTAANVPPGTKWHPDHYASVGYEEIRVLGATLDLSHIVFTNWAALTPDAITEYVTHGGSLVPLENLYVWSGGRLQLVNVLPDGEPQPGAAFGTGDEGGLGGAPNPWALSADGRWVVFRYNSALLGGPYYVRDMAGHKTIPFGGRGHTRFQTMSRDGSRLFYIEMEGHSGHPEGELELFDPASGATTSLTANHPGGGTAGVQDQVMGISEDGSYVYFVAMGVLASGAVKGQDNLYMLHYTGGEWQTTFIAALSGEDSQDWRRNSESDVRDVTSSVTPGGRYLAFMSDRPLTGYDNRDALSGEPDEEVYLYDAQANHLVCVSCNPSGARPVGVFDSPTAVLLMDQSEVWGGESSGGAHHWLAGVIAPDWHTVFGVAFHRASYLSENGRLFFNSSDALVPQDTNGLADVYEYEPPGVGDCTSSSSTFSESSGGCVSLISSGQSASESTFLDASETGNDAFFITASKLTGEDYDTANDVYDAHVCSASVPCRSEPVVPPPCTSGDSCKAAPSPQPEIFGPAPSATFKGTGNVTEGARRHAVKHRARKHRRHARHRKRRGARRASRSSRTANRSRKGGRR